MPEFSSHLSFLIEVSIQPNVSVLSLFTLEAVFGKILPVSCEKVSLELPHIFFRTLALVFRMKHESQKLLSAKNFALSVNDFFECWRTPQRMFLFTGNTSFGSLALLTLALLLCWLEVVEREPLRSRLGLSFCLLLSSCFALLGRDFSRLCASALFFSQ